MRKKIFALCFLFILVANVCFAEQYGVPIGGMGAERLYNKIVEAGVNNGFSRNEFTSLRIGPLGGAYFFEFPRSNPSVTNSVMLSINDAGYVIGILIDGNNINEENSNATFATTVLCLQAIGLNDDEMRYVFSNFKKNNADINPFDELYTSEVYVKKLSWAVTVMHDVFTNAHTQTLIICM